MFLFYTNLEVYTIFEKDSGTSLCYPLATHSCHVSVCPNHQSGRVTPFASRGDIAHLGATGYELDTDVPPMYDPTCCRESPWFRSSSRGVGMCVNAKRFPHFNAYFISPRVRFQEQEDDNPTRCVDVWYCTLEPNEPVKLWPHVSYQISLGLIVHRPLCH